MDASAKAADFDGATYASLGAIRTSLSADVAAAKAKGDTTAAAEPQKKLDAATAVRTTMQTGETLRGLLLTVYGFSVLGDMAGLASNLLYGLAAIMFALAPRASWTPSSRRRRRRSSLRLARRSACQVPPESTMRGKAGET